MHTMKLPRPSDARRVALVRWLILRPIRPKCCQGSRKTLRDCTSGGHVASMRRRSSKLWSAGSHVAVGLSKDWALGLIPSRSCGYLG